MKTTTKILLLFASVFIFSACSSDESEDSCGKIEIVDYSTESTSIYIYFDRGNNVNSTRIEIGPTGFNQGTGTIITTSDNSVYLTDLFPSTTYDVYLTGICSSTEQSVVTKLSSISTDQGQCVGTASISFTQSTTSSINLDLSFNNSSPSYYEVEYGLAGFNLGTGTRVNTSSQFSSNYLTINSIQANTAYDFYVRAVCNSSAPNDTSNFVKYSYTSVGNCPIPYNLNTYVVTGACNVNNGATRAFTWSYGFNAQSYTICIVESGTDQPSATSNAFTTSQNGITISGMFCNWEAFYVRANCSATESSSWAGPYYF